MNCTGNTPGISVSCFNSNYPAFCKEVEANLSKSLTKLFTGLESPTASRMARSDLVSRRILRKRNACNDWTFQLSWSGSRSKCDKACSEYFETIGENCIKNKSSNKGSLDVGCGTYNFEIKPASKNTATKSVSSTSRKTSHETTITTSISSVSKKMSHSPLRASSSRTEVAPKSLSTRSKANFLTSTPLATTESPSSTPTDGSQRPLELRSVVCEDEASLPGHAPISAEHQRLLSAIICYDIVAKHDITSMDSQSEASTYTINPDGTNYFYSVSWVDGCKTTVDRQGVSTPLGESSPQCRDLVTGAYTGCKFLITALTEPN